MQPRWVSDRSTSGVDGLVDEIDEFSELARSAGATVVGSLSARIEKPNPKFFIGSGKVEELKTQKLVLDADLILFNHSLSPAQERNLEKELECRVVDRTGLILDIFAQRARSHEGKLQVELAQLKHMSTRLVRGWTHLERQRGGGIGLTGPGETQLELDRRLLANRVKQLSQRLEKVQVQRTQARRSRQRNAVPVVSLVGYTNAGKSTLFNRLTGAEVYVADQLFATLDPTLRKVEGLASGPAILADTVGFIRDLPHDLVEAFKSTLAETRDADLLLHVIDASDPEHHQHIAEVERVLEEIGAQDIPQILVFNKIDKLDETGKLEKHQAERAESINADEYDVHSASSQSGADARPNQRSQTSSGRRDVRFESNAPEQSDVPNAPKVWVSAVTGAGLDSLRTNLAQALQHDRVHRWLQLPGSAGRLRARLIAAGFVTDEKPAEQGWDVQIDAPLRAIEMLFNLPNGDGAWLKRQIAAQ